MTRRLNVPYSLTRKRIRASFSKYNVFNAMTWRKQRPLSTQYRQLFFAKQESRAYHGDRLTEQQFKNHFRAEQPVRTPLESRGPEREIPFGLQTFVGLERRLDFAVFRSFFASSVRQAAFFILKGSVMVNGVKVRSPGYILRPGDMFSVSPQRVLFALGRPKPSVNQSIKLTNNIIKKFNKYIDRCHANPEKMWKKRLENRRKHRVYNARLEATAGQKREQRVQQIKQNFETQRSELEPTQLLKQIMLGQFVPRKPELNSLVIEIRQQMKPAEQVLKNDVISATSANSATSATSANSTSSTNSTNSANSTNSSTSQLPQLDRLIKSEQEVLEQQYKADLAAAQTPVYDPEFVNRLPPKLDLLPEDADPQSVKLNLPFSSTGKLYGLSDPAKSWFTPWSMRQFVPTFAVLPHHIEICFESCHAVYLRDPVARPGHSEIISPFSLDIHERAYLWYIARRRKHLPKLD